MRAHEVVVAFLNRMEIAFLQSPDGRRVVIPLPDGDRGTVIHIDLVPDDETDEVTIAAVAAPVPPAQRPAVALVLAGLNTER